MLWQYFSGTPWKLNSHNLAILQWIRLEFIYGRPGFHVVCAGNSMPWTFAKTYFLHTIGVVRFTFKTWYGSKYFDFILKLGPNWVRFIATRSPSEYLFDGLRFQLKLRLFSAWTLAIWTTSELRRSFLSSWNIVIELSSIHFFISSRVGRVFCAFQLN